MINATTQRKMSPTKTDFFGSHTLDNDDTYAIASNSIESISLLNAGRNAIFQRLNAKAFDKENFRKKYNKMLSRCSSGIEQLESWANNKNDEQNNNNNKKKTRIGISVPKQCQ